MLKHLLVLTVPCSPAPRPGGDGPRPGRFRTQAGHQSDPQHGPGPGHPGSSGSFHGGLDLSHESGWYIGNWTSNLDPGKPTEIDSYAGFKRPLNNRLGYEMGLIRYSRPGSRPTTQPNSTAACRSSAAGSARP